MNGELARAPGAPPGPACIAGPDDPCRLPPTVLAGVGPARARALERLGVQSLEDLLRLVPRRLERHGGRIALGEAARSVGRAVTVAGRLSRPSFFRRGRRRSVLRATLTDESGQLPVLVFNQPWLRERLVQLADGGGVVELHGLISATKRGPALTSPSFGAPARPLPAPGSLRPVYPTVAGLGQELLRRLTAAALERSGASLADPLPAAELSAAGLLPLAEAVRELHRPSDEAEHARARRRLALELVLALQARLLSGRGAPQRGRARAVRPTSAERRQLAARLPFEPTGAQRRAMEEIAADLARARPMRRLLQGDVGSGKTLVGLHAAMLVAAGGGQSALFVPTEVLAEQHYLGLAPHLERHGLRAVLLTAALSAPVRRRALAELAQGSADLAIGTHALLSADVRFKRLDLALVDEQQRFGVLHRRALLEKGADVHLLLMSATPIPRTLALTLYGDLELSVLDEKPPGRGALRTRVVPPGKKAGLLAWLEERLAAGERAFWICPRIAAAEGAEDEDIAAEAGAADEVQRAFAAGPLGRHGVELVHGRVPVAERSARIARFRRGESRLLVATTIVEVGVDVPEATILVVDGAERFGLAQLHQLRGRVGRGPGSSWCFLLGGRAGLERMRFLEQEHDGFAIAEEDLRRRGMGDLAGLRQAGVNAEGLSGADVDLELVLLARRLLVADPALARRYAAAPREEAVV